MAVESRLTAAAEGGTTEEDTRRHSNRTTTNQTNPKFGEPTWHSNTFPTVDNGGLRESYALSNDGG